MRSTKHQTTTSFGFTENTRAARRELVKQTRTALKQRAEAKKADANDDEFGLPKQAWAAGGEARPKSLRGTRPLVVRGIPTTAHTAATAYPYVAGPSLGPEGVYIGRDLNGGGAFTFDPWELYKRGVISGMSMMLFGQIGTGKSTLAKSLAVRQVLIGRKLAVPSDKKGEWTKVIRALGGVVIQVGPGARNRLNPLDEGHRPGRNPKGEPMGDDEWAMIVRTRRMAILGTLVKILIGNHDMDSEQRYALSLGLDRAVEGAGLRGREVVIPDVIHELAKASENEHKDEVRKAAGHLELTLHRITSGDLAGMFDGESTVTFDPNAPAVSIDSSALSGASPEAVRVVNACAGAWTEAMVTNSDYGQRLVIYEEGWDNISSEADLQRMVESWKLARAYGLFNILVMHKISDLDMAGDQKSRMAAMARSLLADSDVKVIYRQDASALKVTMEELDLSDRERSLIKSLDKGVGLWRLRDSSFEVANDRSRAETPLFDTDERMRTLDITDDSTMLARQAQG